MKKLVLASVAAIGVSSTLSAQAGILDSIFDRNKAKTEHPIVLIPGIYAFDTIAGVDYWYQIPSALESEGATVFVPKINSLDSSAMRGERLIEQLEEIRATSNGSITRFNLIGHSQGGVTARYVMNVRPDLVASVTTAHSPHKGSPVADVVTETAPDGTPHGDTNEAISNAMGDLVNLLSDNKQDEADVNAMLGEFNKAGSAAFNQQFPAGVPESACGQGPSEVTIDGHPIRLYSWSGTSTITTGIDLSDAMFATTSQAFDEGSKNDGITGQCSSHFGKVIKDDYNMNHIDVNNHVLGLVSLFEISPESLFRNHANRLKKAGL